MNTTIQIRNREALIGMLSFVSQKKRKTKESVIVSTIYQYNGLKILNIHITKGTGSSEIWMIEDTSYIWDELAEVIKRNAMYS